MHELAIVEDVIAAASENAEGGKVRRVLLEIGCLAAVLPEAVRFCFDLCAKGTPLDGASLEIVEIPGAARCRACEGPVILDRPFGVCVCGSSDLEWLSGEQLKILEIEVSACA